MLGALLAITASPATSWASATAHASPGPTPAGTDDLTDPGLLEIVADAEPGERIVVEVVGDDLATIRDAASNAGGVVIGSVPGEVAQVSLPAARVDDLAADLADDATDGGDPLALRRPLIANRPVTRPGAPSIAATLESATAGPGAVTASTAARGRAEFGPVTGENVVVTQAAAWHAGGVLGAGVRVGVVDFFDFSLWNPAEHGPSPRDAGRFFCRDSSNSGFCATSGGVPGEEHGVAVVEIVKDMAPDAEIWLATVATASDLRAAIDWFAANGVSIVSRSLGAAYDGPGDGTGPLAAVVDYAATKGITWFNSAGNDAAGSYGRYTEGVDAAGYVDFLAGPGVDTSLLIAGDGGGCVGFDGVRWDDWYQPIALTTDYALELYDSTGTLVDVIDARQTGGAPPLEAADKVTCAGSVTLRMRRTFIGRDPSPDVIEIGLFAGDLEYSQAAYSAAKPVVDSRNPSLVAVGAIDPAAGSRIGTYSSQGPTNDGRIKPDVTAPSCIRSSIYSTTRFGFTVPCFNGTSAAAPSAAGFAALLLGRELAASGPHLAALVKHLVTDLGAPGPDNAFGTGRITLPASVPAPVDGRPAQYEPLATPQRVLDTRPDTATAGARLGPHAPFTVIDLPMPVTDASAVALSIVSTDAPVAGYVQAVPTLAGTLGTSSTLNVAVPGQIQPNFAVVPLGAGSSVTLYLFAGGNVVVDLLGVFRAAPAEPVAAGRFVAVDPVRVLDTRPESAGPVPPEWVPHRPSAGESVRVVGIPAGASAAVVNVVADQAVGSGFLRAQATGAAGLPTSNGNYVAGVASGSLAIVPVGTDGSISVFTSNSTHLVVDLMGYVTGPASAPGRDGLFVPLSPGRLYDSRSTTVHGSLTSRVVQVTGGAVPAGASAVSMNLTSDAAVGPGYLTVFPADREQPLVSNLNYPVFHPRANAGMVRLPADGALNTFVNQTTHVIIDVNGYFTGST